MANVFIEEQTLQNIADAIRTKTEETETMKPSEFADKILSLVIGSGEGGTSVGDSADFKIATGSFDTDETGTGRQTITHGLGVVPDFIMVYRNSGLLGASSNDGTGTYTVTTKLILMFGFHSSFADKITYLSHMCYNIGFVYNDKLGFDQMDDFGKNNGLISCTSDSTFDVGQVSDSGVGNFDGTYNWIAIAGMGGSSVIGDSEYQTAVLNGLEYAESGLTEESTPEEIEVYLKSIFPQKFYIINGKEYVLDVTKNWVVETDAENNITSSINTMLGYVTFWAINANGYAGGVAEFRGGIDVTDMSKLIINIPSINVTLHSEMEAYFGYYTSSSSYTGGTTIPTPDVKYDIIGAGQYEIDLTDVTGVIYPVIAFKIYKQSSSQYFGVDKFYCV